MKLLPIHCSSAERISTDGAALHDQGGRDHYIMDHANCPMSQYGSTLIWGNAKDLLRLESFSQTLSFSKRGAGIVLISTSNMALSQ